MITISNKKLASLIAIFFFYFIGNIFSQNQSESIVFNSVVDVFKSNSSNWSSVIQGYAQKIFWLLAIIGFSWNIGMMALKGSEFGDYVYEIVRFVLFIGFFHWILMNGPEICDKILNSFIKIGKDASATNASSYPQIIVDSGYKILYDAIDSVFFLNISQCIITAIIALGVFISTLLMVINYYMLYCSSWVLVYAGIIALGFGGSKFTSEISIAYLRCVLHIGASLMAMILIINLNARIFQDAIHSMSYTNLKNLCIIFGSSLILVLVSHKIPSMIGSIFNGGSTGNIGQWGAYDLVATVKNSAIMIGKAIASGGTSIPVDSAQAIVGTIAQQSIPFKEKTIRMGSPDSISENTPWSFGQLMSSNNIPLHQEDSNTQSPHSQSKDKNDGSQNHISNNNIKI